MRKNLSAFAVILTTGLFVLGVNPRLQATPIDTITFLFLGGGPSPTAGTAFNASPVTLFVSVFRSGSLPPDEAETIQLTLMQNGVALPNSISPSSFDIVVPGTNYLLGTALTAYFAGSNLQIRATSPTGVQGFSQAFNVTVGAAAKIVVTSPGETYVPGTNPALGSGKSGTPNIQQPGQPFPVTVRLTDNQFNTVNSNDVVSFAAGSLVTLPSPGALTAGIETFNITINAPKTIRSITVSDLTTPAILPGSTSIESAGPPLEEIFPFPSPFNPKNGESITFRFRLETAQNAEVQVTDIFGQKVWEQSVPAIAGTTDLVWNGTNENGTRATPGIYYAILKIGGSVKDREKFGVKR